MITAIQVRLYKKGEQLRLHLMQGGGGGFLFTPFNIQYLRFDPPGRLRAGQGGGAKMNFPILTSTIMWGIKYGVFNSVDSES